MRITADSPVVRRHINPSTILAMPVVSADQDELMVVDATFMMADDVLEIRDDATGNVERVRVDGDPPISGRIRVERGLWSQDGGFVSDRPLPSIVAASPVNLTANPRTGFRAN